MVLQDGKIFFGENSRKMRKLFYFLLIFVVCADIV